MAFRVKVPDPMAAAPEPSSHSYNFDLAVIGGGSGGLACAKQAASHGAKVCVFDFVTPTPSKTTWGIGGTCLNVGCIPKKLMHTASIYGEIVEHSKQYGWELAETKAHNWSTMVQNIQGHIKKTNWSLKVDLREKEIQYYNEHCSFVDQNTVKGVNKAGKERIVTADKFVLAMGGRPNYPDTEGASSYAITSDDIFSLKYHPGKTLCIGASYISLETAGFLAGLGIDTTVMVRSIFLRGFDQECAEKIGEHMLLEGHVKFIRPATPNKIECIKPEADGNAPELKVYYTEDGVEKSDTFNTVVFAIGRTPCTKLINPDAIGLKYHENGKVPVSDTEQTNLSNVYAIGDIVDAPELTPLAIQAGRLLAKRLYDGSSIKCDYQNIPTTVFTPLEYGSCGMSEEDAIKQYGEDNIEVYHTKFEPTEQTILQKETNHNFAKMICNMSDNERVLGIHYLGPNAGEILGGFGMALVMGATKSDFDRLVGIHPTAGEVFTTMKITKRSGADIDGEDC